MRLLLVALALLAATGGFAFAGSSPLRPSAGGRDVADAVRVSKTLGRLAVVADGRAVEAVLVSNCSSAGGGYIPPPCRRASPPKRVAPTLRRIR